MWEGYCLKGLHADKPDIEWHEVHEKPFSIHGLLCKDALTRMSDEDSSRSVLPCTPAAPLRQAVV